MKNYEAVCKLHISRATLELALKHVTSEKKLEKEAFLRAQKENEKESRNVKKLELQLKACQDSLSNVQLAYEKILEQVGTSLK